MFSKKLTFEKISQFSFGVIIVSMKNWDISSNFCGLLRKHELLKVVFLNFCCILGIKHGTFLFEIGNTIIIMQIQKLEAGA